MCRWLVVLLASGSLWAGARIVSTRVYCEPPGAAFTVDGRTYNAPATFFWPEGSTHLLGLTTNQTAEPNIFRLFKQWENSAGQKLLDGPNIAITASGDITFYKAVWKVYYAINLVIGGDPSVFSCRPGTEWGKVYINIPDAESCYSTTQVVWGESSKSVQIQVYTPPGYAFLGWAGTFDGSTAPALAFTLNSPVFLTVRLAPAARITLATSPPGLTVYADRQPVLTPHSFDWASGSQHAIGVAANQRDSNGAPWVFDSWSDGGAEYHDYTVADTTAPVTLTARMIPGVSVGVISSPPGLKLTVDGRTSATNSFLWGLGSKHTLAAPVEQADATGRHYRFRSWSIGVGATQEVTVGAESTGWIAAYDALNALTVAADPAAVSFTVDGDPCQGSCTVYRPAGTPVAIAAPRSVPIAEGTRVDFQTWSDGNASPTRTVTLDSDRRTLTAAYPYFHLLSVTSDPASAADYRFEPVSPDGYFQVGSTVVVQAVARPGYRFRYWEGDLSGAIPSGSLRMGGPRSLRAGYDRVPYIAPAGVKNAAAETSEPGLAPGSIIAIYGASMALDPVAGPPSPLVQTLAGVTVRMGDRILPLFFVSPGQINALLPSGVALGDASLTVHWEGHEPVSAEFRVVRNAPGLFTAPVDRVPYALATHADGALVNAANPAVPGETVTLYGTGFGPTQGIAPDGFAIPAGLNLPLADPVRIQAGGLNLDPEFAGAAEGQVGVVAIRFRIPRQPPSPLELTVSVNGKPANQVVVPVQQANSSNNSETADQ